MEIYVRALAVDVNDLLVRKQNYRSDFEKIHLAEIELAAKFDSLADLVRDKCQIRREIILTSFSLHPTKDKFDHLVELATVVDSTNEVSGILIANKSSHIEDEDSGIDVDEKCSRLDEEKPTISDCSADMSVDYGSKAASDLGVSKQIFDDLFVVVHSLKTLTKPEQRLRK